MSWSDFEYGALRERRRLRRLQARIVKLLREWDRALLRGGIRRINMAAALRYAAYDLDQSTRAPRRRTNGKS